MNLFMIGQAMMTSSSVCETGRRNSGSLHMNTIRLVMSLGLSSVVTLCVTCSTLTSKQPLVLPATSPTPSISNTNQDVNSEIRKIDFANFTYPAEPVYGGGLKTFTLRSRKYEGAPDFDPVYLTHLVYGDVTDDGKEEALVTLGISVRGSATPFVNYIYTEDDHHPKLLWAFENGDRADEGLRQVYAENGGLVVERFSPIGKNGAFATQFTRTRFLWRGNRFVQNGTPELLPNPELNSSPVMTPYRSQENEPAPPTSNAPDATCSKCEWTSI